MSGNLIFAGPIVSIDGATVGNAAVFPVAAASTWTIDGTGLTSWTGTVIKGSTEAVPGSGGPFVSGTVTINRCVGAEVSVAPGATLQIDAGTLNAGGTGDPFTDTTTGVNVIVTNNSVFNITEGFKNVASIGGVGLTTVSMGAILDVGSTGPVTQGTFTINGVADAGDVNVSGTTGLGAGSLLVVNYVRGGTLAVGSGNVFMKVNGGAGGVSHVGPLTFGAGGRLDITNNHIVTTSAVGVWGGASYSGLTGQIATGRGTGVWDGASGIVTSMTDATLSGLTSVGIATASQVKGIPAAATAVWAGRTVTGSDTLIMYTYAGDANLDGKINVDDYGKIDFGIGIGLTGWINGDFNYDGKLNVDDYGIIDFNVGIQGAPFFTAGGSGPSLSGVSAIPEPAAALALLVTSSAAFLGRRRQRIDVRNVPRGTFP
jgi:hypothetical protein